MKPTTAQIKQLTELLKNKNAYQVHKITGVSRHFIRIIAVGRSIKNPITDAEIIEASKYMTYKKMVSKFKCSHSRIASVIAKRVDNDFNKYNPVHEDAAGNFSHETMGQPF